jgi:hypothetical protein
MYYSMIDLSKKTEFTASLVKKKNKRDAFMLLAKLIVTGAGLDLKIEFSAFLKKIEGKFSFFFTKKTIPLNC